MTDDNKTKKAESDKKVATQAEIEKYIAELDALEAKVKRLELLEKELAASPGAQARGIAWTDLWGQKTDENGDVKAVKINITQRSDVDSEDALRQLISTISGYAKEIKMTPYVQSARIPTQNGAPQQQPKTTTPPATSAPPGVAPTTPPQGSAPPPGSTPKPIDDEMQHFTVSKIVTIPQENEKVTVELWGQGRIYPDLYINRSLDKISEIFPEGWKRAYFEIPQSYNVNLIADFKVSSKLNSKGNPYKDVYKMRAIE